jgi:putative radical SAM enzyme (TIGR03279 family)
MPKGMRDTLYFKDDDPRLSFLTGNYVTLTNINGDELNRLISYRLSPVNVSVHTTNPELRVKMLKNKNAGDIMDKLKKLGEANIELNCQIVLCPGINDGDELVKTVEDLISLGSSVKSLSVVPVGITRFRENLPEIKLYGENEAREIIQYVEATQKKLKKQRGTNFIYAADELYISANMEIPKYSEYEDFPQIENGVGMMALLKHEVKEYINETVKSTRSPMNRKVTIATGVAAYDIIKELACEVEKLFDGLKVQVLSITNTFFGETVTVAGLLTAGDIINQLDGIDLGDELLISKNMLKQDEAVFLDDYTLEDFEKAVGVKVTPVGDSGKEFVEKTGGIKLE